MELSDFKDDFDQALENGMNVVFFCQCEISYSGRAEAYVPLGDRTILIKNDRVVLVHQPEHGNPINYLKAGAEIKLEKSKEGLLLRARSGKDYLDVEIQKVYDCMVRKLEDGQKQLLQGNERDMSDMIKDNPKLISDDFIPLTREEHTKFGFIDVFGHDGAGNMVVVECKRYNASLACVTQLRRYVEKIEELKGVKGVKGVMAAPGITANALAMLEQWGFTHVVVLPPKRLEVRKDQMTLGTFT